MTKVELPFPVPLHALWVKHRGGGGVPSKRYQEFGREAWAMIAQQRPQKVKGAVSANILLVAPDKRRRDGDNLLKCVFDTLKNNGLIEDDSNQIVKRFTVDWSLSGPPCTILIHPYEEGLAQ